MLRRSEAWGHPGIRYTTFFMVRQTGDFRTLLVNQLDRNFIGNEIAGDFLGFSLGVVEECLGAGRRWDLCITSLATEPNSPSQLLNKALKPMCGCCLQLSYRHYTKFTEIVLILILYLAIES